MNIYQVFVTVVKLGGFSAAAKKLHRSPSSISKKMSLLEQRLNVQLFDRTTRNLAVTESGKLYYQRCQDIARMIDDAESELTGFSAEPSGTIKVTWPNSISSSSVVDVLGALNDAFPDIKVDVNVDNDHVNLIDDNIDFAFRMDPSIDSSMIAIELFKITPVICASPAFVQRYGEPESIESLANSPLLLLNYSSAIQKFWKSLPGFKGLELEDHHRVNDINALHSMVKKGLGATMMFRHMIEKDLSEGKLIELLPTYPFSAQPVYLMFHKYGFTPKKMSVFIEFFKEHYLSGELNLVECSLG